MYGSLYYTNWIRQALGHYSSSLATAVQGMNICPVISMMYQVTCLKGNVRLCVQPLLPEWEECGKTLRHSSALLGTAVTAWWWVMAKVKGLKGYVHSARHTTMVSHTICVIPCTTPLGNQGCTHNLMFTWSTFLSFCRTLTTVLDASSSRTKTITQNWAL